MQYSSCCALLAVAGTSGASRFLAAEWVAEGQFSTGVPAPRIWGLQGSAKTLLWLPPFPQAATLQVGAGRPTDAITYRTHADLGGERAGKA